ncbi:hypothetical protein [Clostridium scatologenes]|uniref:Uncharacterized protein n=1 Tax=Clostridium scatologenes TaxID=1548 RepID=A0A0E3M976_CLOSL|nr:hypothetical protein [Clostridium scatologenes]AKA69215.1 hypothetical protein CSCA_2090 [Clostridium scatologenes]
MNIDSFKNYYKILQVDKNELNRYEFKKFNIFRNKIYLKLSKTTHEIKRILSIYNITLIQVNIVL